MLGMPGIWLTPVLPWQPAQAAVATVLPACTGSILTAAPAAVGVGGIETRKIGRHFDHRVIAQELDRVVHGAVAAGTGLVGLHFNVEIGRALACKVGHAGVGVDTVRAVAAGAGRSREPLSFGNLLRHGVQRAKVVGGAGRHGLSHCAWAITHDHCAPNEHKPD